MIPHEIRMIAQAVLDGDETAALALYDALAEVRGNLAGKSASEKAMQELLNDAIPYIRCRIGYIETLDELCCMRAEDLYSSYSSGGPNLGKRAIAWVQGWLQNRGLSLRSSPMLLKLKEHPSWKGKREASLSQ